MYCYDPILISVISTTVFTIFDVLLAGKLRINPFGVLVLDVMIVVDDRTIHDMVLTNSPVFYGSNSTNLVMFIIHSFFTIFLTISQVHQVHHPLKWMVLVFDTIELVMFIDISVNKLFIHGTIPIPLIAMYMGIINYRRGR